MVELLEKENIVISRHAILAKNMIDERSINISSVSDKHVHKVRIKFIIINKEFKKKKYPIKFGETRLYIPLLSHREEVFILNYQQEREPSALGNSTTIVLRLKNNSFKVITALI